MHRPTRSGSRCRTLVRRRSRTSTRARSHEPGLLRRIQRAGPRGRATFAFMALLTAVLDGGPRYALLGRARRVTAERNGCDGLADECLPFAALAEADCRRGSGTRQA
jgi:hypothetical protein